MRGEREYEPVHLGAAGVVVIAVLLVCAPAARAQDHIHRDGTMGPAGAILPDGELYTIDETDGRLIGTNLFHSFSRFNLRSGYTAELTNSLGSQIGVVIARQTGPEPLTLDGLFRSAIPGADVYLISPSGITTKAGAKLDVPAAMYMSGASDLRFSDGAVLDATGTLGSPQLTAASPVAFGFGPGSGPVNLNRSVGLRVSPGHTLSFTGTQIVGSGALGSSSIEGPGTIVQLGAASSGELPLDLSTVDPADESRQLGPIGMISRFSVDVSSAETGIQAGRIVIRGSSFTQLGTLRSENQVASSALGSIDIGASESITVTGSGTIETESSGGGAASGIELNAPQISLTNGASVTSDAEDDSSGGGISLTGRQISITTGAEVRSEAEDRSFGGDIEIETSEVLISGAGTDLTVGSQDDAIAGLVHIDTDGLTLTQGASLASNTTASSDGAGGGILLEAASDVLVADGAQLISASSGAARGGDVTIVGARSLEVIDGGRVRTEATRSGQGGTLSASANTIRVAKDPTDDRATDISTGVLASASSSARGGDLIIDADSIEMTGGGQIAVDTSGAARQGDLDVTARDTIFARGTDAFGRPSGLFSQAQVLALAASPDERALLSVNTRDLELRDGALISASTFGDAHGSDIEIVAAGAVRIGRASELASFISSSAIGQGSTGSGGRIVVDADTVELRGGGEIVTDTLGRGAAGRIEVSARRIEVEGRDVNGARSRISSESKAVDIEDAGDAGAILLVAEQDVRVANEGVVSVSTAGTGGGGSIVIDAGRSVTLSNGAEIRAAAETSADAGSITILAGERFESSESAVITRATIGGGGQVHIEASRLVYLIDSTIDARVKAGAGDGGDVFIDPDVVVLNNSPIIARAEDGRGGNITIIADQLLQSRGSELIATSETNVPGEVVTTAPESELPSELASIERPFLDASDLMGTPCDLRSERSGSLTVTLAAAARPAPDRILDASLLRRSDRGDAHGMCAPAGTVN